MDKNFGVIAASKIWHLPSLALHDLVFYITALFCHWDAHLGLFSGGFITTLEKSRGPEGTTGKLLSIILFNFVFAVTLIHSITLHLRYRIILFTKACKPFRSLQFLVIVINS